MSIWTHDVVNNSEEYRKFAHTLGYAVLNCGDIELFSYSYAAALSGTHVFDTGLARRTFSQRIDAIRKLLKEAEINDELAQVVTGLWNDATDVMRWRNIFAHNPITVISITRKDGAKERHAAIINMQKTTSQRTEHIELEQLAKIVNQAEKVARGLSECLPAINEELAGK